MSNKGFGAFSSALRMNPISYSVAMTDQQIHTREVS